MSRERQCELCQTRIGRIVLHLVAMRRGRWMWNLEGIARELRGK